MKNKTSCRVKCCFHCTKVATCPAKCGEPTDKDCVGVPYNDCPNFVKIAEKEDDKI